MKGLRIEIKEIPLPQKSSKIENLFGGGLLILIGILSLPLILIFWIGAMIINLLPSRKAVTIANEWQTIVSDNHWILKFRWINADDLTDYLHGYFDIQPLIEYRSDPEIDFFQGYFTDFRLERTDGIFVQKVNHDPIKEEVTSLPLCFFNYQTKEVEEIKDLKDYELDTKGNPDDFMISAIGDGHELQIRLKRK
ncbi:hypothetical protein [Tunicatimonas pelagia]|uniref:hypothetical protein n=1 Tax=Tunicatimonas pelagia TaxID=931531 RepID=UPI002666C9F2|nr:hypothetical protein [Tunicatimonas pelagia]WKN41678.1 hypothetical protein P0M28_21815 [Tunicatimonas pelagia]